MRRIIYHIRRVRSQPEDVRQSILHIFTLSFGVILFFLWVLSLGSGSKEETTAQNNNQSTAPLSALKANLADGYNSVFEFKNTDIPEEQTEGLYVDPNY